MNITTATRGVAHEALVTNGLTAAQADTLLLQADNEPGRTWVRYGAMVAYDLESGTYTVASAKPTTPNYDPHPERKLQPGQHYDAGYPVPDLAIGQRLAGSWTVVAAIRHTDRPGYMPGLHTVVAYDPTNDATPYVTWEVYWDQRHGWSATMGHYIWASSLAFDEAVADMAKRAHWSPEPTPGPGDPRPLLHLSRHDLARLAYSGDAEALAEWQAREQVQQACERCGASGPCEHSAPDEPVDIDPDQPERDLQEEAYNRAFCPACGTSPCESEDGHEAERIAETYGDAAADQADQEA